MLLLVCACSCRFLCDQLDVRAKEDLLQKDRKIQQLLKTVASRQSSISAASSHATSVIGSPSMQGHNSASASAAAHGDTHSHAAIVEPPLLELLHHPELLKGLALSDAPLSPSHADLAARAKDAGVTIDNDNDGDVLLLTGGSDA